MSHLSGGSTVNFYSFTRFLNISPTLLELCFRCDNFYTILILLHCLKTLSRVNSCYESPVIQDSLKLKTKNMLWINYDLLNHFNYDEPIVKELIRPPKTIETLLTAPKKSAHCYIPKVVAEYFDITCSSTQSTYQFNSEINPRILSSLFYGPEMIHAENVFSTSENLPALGLSYIPTVSRKYSDSLLLLKGLTANGIYERDPDENLSHVEVPSFESLIADSAKLQYLDTLLPYLKQNGHRVLIFCQVI